MIARIFSHLTSLFLGKSGFRIRTNSDFPKVIARISLHSRSGYSGQIRISHPDKFGHPHGTCPDFSASHIRINPDSHIRKCPKTLFSKQASKQASKTGFSFISHPDKFGHPKGNCPDISADHIRIFLKNPGNHLRSIRKNPDSQFRQDFSSFRVRTNSDSQEAIARVSPHFTSAIFETSGQSPQVYPIKSGFTISHTDKFGYP